MNGFSGILIRMIGMLSGTVAYISQKSFILDVGGIGYEVFASDTLINKLDTNFPVRIFTHYALRENAAELFGFERHEELRFFRELIEVSGIGPRSAIGILSLAPLETLAGAIASGKSEYLTKVSGIGKKTAEKIILELKDKVAEFGEVATDNDYEALDALIALGYSTHDAREALRGIDSTITDTRDKIKAALQALHQ